MRDEEGWVEVASLEEEHDVAGVGWGLGAGGFGSGAARGRHVRG